ncbi:diaminopimelate decarboxylase [Paenibacillus elgii]|uniref:Diaminopimelate decarboxylase n=1 Tax=Paenibacillus elgii TaxID=189691 RepID=A0A2T6FTH8_9BACL|nr:alanine racemase [Paenibacillus elgii]PUA35216.1 diaminopimelate decarboxylase [Paenibacillus elgii]
MFVSSERGDRLHECAERFGTPLYVYDFGVIRERLDALRRHLHPSVSLFYSIKANPNTTVVRHIYEAGANLELCSPLELDIALAAGADPRRILYVGPGKTEAELNRLLTLDVRYIVAESLQELELMNRLAGRKGVRADVGVRFNPKAAIHGARLKMGGAARQFGIDEEQVADAVRLIESSPFLRLAGLHAYYGTRILSAETVAANMAYILGFAERAMAEHALELDYIGLGGGFGVPYYEGEAPLDLSELSRKSHGLLEMFAGKHPGIRLLMETGRYVVAESGTYLTRVLYTKQSQGKWFAVTDGGTNHHAAAGGAGSLMRRNFPVRAWTRESGEPREYAIAGPLCTPGDTLGDRVTLPPLEPGDLIGILASGAYCLTMSPVLFLSHALPREVLLLDEKPLVVREKYEYAVPALRS